MLILVASSYYDYLEFYSIVPDFMQLIDVQLNDMNAFAFCITFAFMLLIEKCIKKEILEFLETKYSKQYLRKAGAHLLFCMFVAAVVILLIFLANVIVFGLKNADFILSKNQVNFIISTFLLSYLRITLLSLIFLYITFLSRSEYAVAVVLGIGFIDWGYYLIFNTDYPTGVLLGEYSIYHYAYTFFSDYTPNYEKYYLYWGILFFCILVIGELSILLKMKRGS